MKVASYINDFNWIEGNIIKLIHEDMPFANNNEDKRIYFEILRDATMNWFEKHPEHLLITYFPMQYKGEIKPFLQSKEIH